MTANPALDSPALRPVIDRAVSDLVDRPRRISPAVAQAVIARAVHEAHALGRRDAIRDLHTIGDAATALGIDRSRVFRLSRARGIGTTVGRERLFTGADIEAIRAVSTGKPGRPRKAAAG